MGTVFDLVNVNSGFSLIAQSHNKSTKAFCSALFFFTAQLGSVTVNTIFQGNVKTKWLSPNGGLNMWEKGKCHVPQITFKTGLPKWLSGTAHCLLAEAAEHFETWGRGGSMNRKQSIQIPSPSYFAKRFGFFLLIIIIINDIYPGSSTHSKVIFREVLHAIELEFGNVDFWGEGKTREPREKPLRAEQRNNKQLNLLMATSPKSNPGQVGGRQVQSPLSHPCSKRSRLSFC